MKLDGSGRQLAALLAASAAAPYLTSLFLSLHLLNSHGITSVGDAFEFVAGLVIYGIPITLAASIFGTILIAMGLYHRITAIIFGAALGGAFQLGLTTLTDPGRRGNDFWPYLISMTFSGAICGWIYWRIATGGRTKAPLA
jgi:hypothetical protein